MVLKGPFVSHKCKGFFLTKFQKTRNEKGMCFMLQFLFLIQLAITWPKMVVKWSTHCLVLFVSGTLRPRDTQPQAARTLTMHVFELSPKIFEMLLPLPLLSNSCCTYFELHEFCYSPKNVHLKALLYVCFYNFSSAVSISIFAKNSC